MESLSSTEFRKTFSRLTEPTEVTVNGHVIGTWLPGNGRWHSGEIIPAGAGKPLVTSEVRFDTQPVRAVPKKK